MRGLLQKLGASAVLGLLLVTVGCSETADDSVVPGFAPLASMGESAHVRVTGSFNNPQGNGLTCDPTGDPDEGTGGQYQSAVWIDRDGGRVIIAGTSDEGAQIAHALVVPKGAVRENTLFCMRLFTNNHMQVKLKAYTIQRKGKKHVEVINVGKEGFRVPVQLYMSYHQARVTRLDDSGQASLAPVTSEEARRLSVAYEPDASELLEPMPTWDLSQWDKYVVASLPHFSKYVLILD